MAINNNGGSVVVNSSGQIQLIAASGQRVVFGAYDISSAGWGDIDTGYTSALTENAAQISALLVVREGNPASAYAGTLEGIDVAAWSKTTSTQNFTNLAGGLKGIGAAGVHRGSGTVTSSIGVAGVIFQAGSGTTTTGNALFAFAPSFTAGALTNNNGLTVQNQGAAGIVNAIGVNILAQSGATNNYAILTAGGIVGLNSGAGQTGGIFIGNTTGGVLTLAGNGAGTWTPGDGTNLVLGTVTGTQIGTATTQKIGHYGATPVVQPSSTGNVHTVAAGSVTNVFVNTTFDGSTGATAYTVGDIVHHLKVLGLIAS